VQLYVTDLYGSVSRPVRELKGFAKILLEPGETRDVAFELGRRDLMFVGRDHTWIFEPGQFRFAVGDQWRELDIR
jgi:beta-glucosidase